AFNNCDGIFVNCTIADNTAATDGALRFCDGRFVNCIIRDNSPAIPSESLAVFEYCCLDWVEGGAGNIFVDPNFVNSAGGDYHLTGSSLCIDAGTNTPVGGLSLRDIDGILRPMDGDGNGVSVADMGVYEYVPAGVPVIEPSALEFTFDYTFGGSAPVDQTLTLDNSGTGALNWSISDDASWLTATPSSGDTLGLGGPSAVTLSVSVTGLGVGQYEGELIVDDNLAANNLQKVTVILNIIPDDSFMWVPYEYSTIQAAVDAAVHGDTVMVTDGTYRGPGNRDIDFRGKAITVRSENGPENCIIDCEGNANVYHRGFYLHNNETDSSIIDGFSIINGYFSWASNKSSGGGGVDCDSTSPTIRNCIMRNNYGHHGGAIRSVYSHAKIDNCLLVGNGTVDGGHGAGVYCYASSAEVTNLTFYGNIAMEGGGRGGAAIYTQAGHPNIRNCIMWGNTYLGVPNAVKVYSGSITVSYSDIEDGWSGTGNIDRDPLFADAENGDFHLKSQEGRWNPNQTMWVFDNETSNCIDRGDPSDSVGLEPIPNSNRINVGYYSGTEQASKSYDGPWLNMLIYPNGGETYLTGTVHNIMWNVDESVPTVKIEYSVDNGNSWSEVNPTNIGNTGSYAWTIPYMLSDDCLVRTIDPDVPEKFDVSDEVFSITASHPKVLTPNGDEEFLTGVSTPIKWHTTGEIDAILIEYSLDEGANWLEVNPQNVGNNGNYNWMVPDTLSDDCLVRVSDGAHSGIADISDSVFRINGLDLLSPDGGEGILTGSRFDIMWDTSPLIESHMVKIEYSFNGGNYWEEEVVTDNDGLYEWKVPTIESNQYLLRITDVDQPDHFDVSRDTFKVFSCRVTIPGDINGDCAVDMFDFVLMAQNWLQMGYIEFDKEALDANPLWEMEGEWAFGAPMGQGGLSYGYPDPNIANTGNYVYGVNLNGNYSTEYLGVFDLTAGPFYCKHYNNILLKFSRWLNTDISDYTEVSIEVSNDGVNWVEVWANLNTPITDNDWTNVEYDISSVADGEEAVFIRWRYEVKERALPYSGWNIDDICLWGTPK
ncbi:MAG: hypothetical protein GY869_03375, partial [Planctomycetes bacterium]|nr:hypothetical protein [Planctomycetota bacterium]